MSNLFLKDLIVYGVLILFVLYVTRINNMWGVKKGVTKAKVDIRKDASRLRRKNNLLLLLSRITWFAENVGFAPSEAVIADYQYKLNRLRWEYPLLERGVRPLEVIGALKIIKYLGVLLGVIGAILTKSIVGYLPFLTLLAPTVFRYYVDIKIAEEDAELEKDFPDLYLLLYTRLKKGVYTRLAPALDDYLRTLNTVYGEGNNKAIKYFVLDLRNNIELYADDSLAIGKMRENYRSAMIVNFCNLAIQSLSGVDNSDKLLTFKVELVQKQMDRMEQRAEELAQKGQRVVMSILVILFQFVVLSWTAKLGGVDTIKGILGG